MKRCGKAWVGAITCLTIVTVAQGATDNPYLKIADRNVFSLKPPLRPEDNLPPPTPIPKLTLQGITSILGRRQVLFRRQTISLPGSPASEKSYMLTEGQREDDIDVMAIDVEAGTVKFNNNGTIQLLDMKNNSAKATPGAPAPPQAAAARNVPGGPAGGDLRKIPQRPVRVEPAAGDGNASANTGDANNAAPAEPVTPQVDAMEAQVPKTAQGHPLSFEEQSILIELERERTKPMVEAGELPPLPATDITPPGSIGIADPSTETQPTNP